MYRIELQNKARHQLDKIFGGRDADRISVAILALGENPRPHGIKKLVENIYRIRVGDWRVIFSIDDREKKVVVVKIARRSEDTYNNIEELF